VRSCAESLEGEFGISPTMISEATEALVLKTVPYANTSLIVTFYTEKYGRLTVMARGARRREKTTEGAIDLLTLGEAVFYLKRGRGMATLKSYEPYENFAGIRDSLDRFDAAAALVEYLLEGVADYESERELFVLSVAALDGMGSEHPGSVLAAYLVQALKISGILPSQKECSACGKALPQKQPIRFSTVRGGFYCRDCIGEDSFVEFPGALCAVVEGLLGVGDRLRTVSVSKGLLVSVLRFCTLAFEVSFGRRLRRTEKIMNALRGGGG